MRGINFGLNRATVVVPASAWFGVSAIFHNLGYQPHGIVGYA